MEVSGYFPMLSPVYSLPTMACVNFIHFTMGPTCIAEEDLYINIPHSYFLYPYTVSD